MFACLHLSRKKFNRIFPSLIDLLLIYAMASFLQKFWLSMKRSKRKENDDFKNPTQFLEKRNLAYVTK